MRIQRANVLYGGTGYSALRSGYASLLEKQPGAVFSAGLLQAGVASAGLAAYGLEMLNVPMAVAGPVGLAVGAAAAIGSGAMQVYGATSEPATTALQAVAQDRRYQQTIADRTSTGSRFSRPVPILPTSANLAEMWQAGTGQNKLPFSIEYYKTALTDMEKIRVSGNVAGAAAAGQDVWDYVQSKTIVDPETGQTRKLTKREQDEEIALHAKSLATSYSVEAQATYSAMALEKDYGLRLTQGKGGEFEKLATGLQQGLPYEQLAMTMAQAPGRTLEQQRAEAGTLMERFLLRPGGLDALYTARMQQGAQRYQGLGEVAAPVSGAFAEQFMGGLGSMTQGAYARLQMEAQIQGARREMGLSYRTLGDTDRARYAGMSDADRLLESRLQKFDASIVSTLGRIEDSFRAIGEKLPDMSRYDLMSRQPGGMMQLQAVLQQQQVGMNIGQQILAGGGTAEAAAATAGSFAGMTPQEANRYQELFQFNRQRWGAELISNPSLANLAATGGQIQGYGGQEIPLSIFSYVGVQNPANPNAPGTQLTGMPWGRTSIATAGVYSANQVQQQIWGAPETWAGKGYDTGLINALTSGGTLAGEAYQRQIGWAYQQQQFGQQWAQIGLQQWYQPQQFAFQRQGMQMNWAQQAWGLEMQGRQLQLQQSQFQENTGLQQQQMMMQRGWQMQDWAMQDRTRAMQWGWKQEDYAESIRFTTGRERRLAERQMGRETIMYGIEGEQLDKQKARQKELWALEDERFELQKKQHEESLALQEENLAKQKEFFEQRKELEAEQQKLSEEYWRRNMELQESALSANEGYATQMQAITETMVPLSTKMEELNGQFNLLSTESIANLNEILISADEKYRTLYEDEVKKQEQMAAEAKLVQDEVETRVDLNETLSETIKLTQEWVKAMIAASQAGAPSAPTPPPASLDFPTAPPGSSSFPYNSVPPSQWYPTPVIPSSSSTYVIPAGGGSSIQAEDSGGPVTAGTLYEVNERGTEYFRPDTNGAIIPLRDPWGASMLGPTLPDNKSIAPIHLMVTIGGERLIDQILSAVDQEVHR